METQSPIPIPTRSQKHVTFQDSELSSGEGPLMRWHVGQSPDRRKTEECDLGPPLTLEAKLEQFLGEPAVMQGVEGGAICLRSPLS